MTRIKDILMNPECILMNMHIRGLEGSILSNCKTNVMFKLYIPLSILNLGSVCVCKFYRRVSIRYLRLGTDI